MPDASVLQIVILNEGNLVATEVVLPGTYTIGSDPGADLVLDDAMVSAAHAVLAYRDGRVFLEDAGSISGILVNGERSRAAEITPKDDVTIGPFTLKVRAVAKKPAAAGAVKPTPAPSAPQPQASRPTVDIGNAPPGVVRPSPVTPPRPQAPAVQAAPATQPKVRPQSTPAPAATPKVQPGLRPTAAAPRTAPPPPAAPAPAPVRTAPPAAPTSQPPRPKAIPIPQPPPAVANGRPTAPEIITADLQLEPLPKPARKDELPLSLSDKELAALKRTTADDWAELSVGPLISDDGAVQTDPRVGNPPPPQPPPPQKKAVAPPAPQKKAPEPLPQPGVDSTLPTGFSTVEVPIAADAGPATVQVPAVAAPSIPLPDVGSVDPRGRTQLRVRVFWGSTVVAVRSFANSGSVVAGPDERLPVPLYGFTLPKERFALASFAKGGWRVNLPKGATLQSFENGRWGRFEITEQSQPSSVALDHRVPLRVVDGKMAVELAVANVTPLPKGSFKANFDLSVVVPFVATALLTTLAIVFMPPPRQDNADFSPKDLAPIRAALVPPKKEDKPKLVKKLEEQKQIKKVEPKPAPQPQPKQEVAEKAPPTPKQTQQAIKAVQKLVAGPAVQSILAATAKIGSGPKGYGDKGMGYKLSPLNGKPPVAMAGIGFGQGLGGFGTQTKGMGSLRGMGNGGAPGQFAIGALGKGGVSGMVVQAPSRGATVKGTMDREAVAKVINEHIAEVRGCYERALLREPGLAGKLVLEWTIGTNGSVSAVSIKQAMKSGEVTNCIVSSLKTWQFPKPTGGVVVVSYPFLFNSVGF